MFSTDFLFMSHDYWIPREKARPIGELLASSLGCWEEGSGEVVASAESCMRNRTMEEVLWAQAAMGNGLTYGSIDYFAAGGDAVLPEVGLIRGNGFSPRSLSCFSLRADSTGCP